ncbi:hypothetical protein FSP39_005208 [Pinctada imbricata]|uniref:Uncharacterized protein n=1 Tax=Pinctada imbricata TaxID=66713 RepID=A0AA88YD02_PINIB|nr:hypothetical protein FSP39_005208 [Pinctada imbricata]
MILNFFERYSAGTDKQRLKTKVIYSVLLLFNRDILPGLNLKSTGLQKKSTVTTIATEASTTTTTEITTATSATQTTDSVPAATDHSKIRFIEDTTFPTGLDSIFTTDKKTEQSTSSDVFGMPSFPPDLNMFTDSMDPFSFDTSNAPTTTDVVPNLSESTTSDVPQKEKTTERVLSEVKSDTTVRTTTPTPPPIVPADDTALETSGQFVPVSVIENVHNDGRIDVGHDAHDKTHNGDGHHDINYFNKTQGEDTEQLDKDTITVIVIGSIIGVVIFIAIIVILVTFLKARKGSGDLPDVNEKDLEMNGSTKGIDNPLIQLEQETNASFPPPNAEDTSGKPNGHASSEPSSSAVKEDMNSTIDSIEIAQNDSISDTGGKSVSL